ncbi:MAG TPA: beta-ketoacyl synthase N-terminal-like domain-containing protein, partial [Gaiellaceae bacterium]
MDGSQNGRRRVVITGVGMVSPLGSDAESTWTSLVAGECGAGPITRFDPSEYAVRFACELKDYEPTTWIDRKQARRMDTFSQFAVSAARMAEADSGIVIADEPDRVGAAIATGIGGLTAFEDCVRRLIERGPDRTSPLAIVQIIPNMAAAWVSMELGAQGPLAAECTACAASNMAIGDGLDAIRLGRAEVMLCGGTEAPVTHVGIAGFSAMRALSQRNDDPKAASRPFDSGRDGFVMGEAAAVVVL